MTAERPNIFVRHSRLTLAAIIFVSTTIMMIGAEWILRTFGSLTIDYYTGFKTPGLHRYPFGDWPINMDGCPDEEFIRGDAKHRIGYVGDSVAAGVGAGYGYRIKGVGSLCLAPHPRAGHRLH